MGSVRQKHKKDLEIPAEIVAAQDREGRIRLPYYDLPLPDFDDVKAAPPAGVGKGALVSDLLSVEDGQRMFAWLKSLSVETLTLGAPDAKKVEMVMFYDPSSWVANSLLLDTLLAPDKLNVTVHLLPYVPKSENLNGWNRVVYLGCHSHPSQLVGRWLEFISKVPKPEADSLDRQWDAFVRMSPDRPIFKTCQAGERLAKISEAAEYLGVPSSLYVFPGGEVWGMPLMSIAGASGMQDWSAKRRGLL